MIVTTVRVSQSTIKDSIGRSIEVLGDECNLNFIDTALITNMEYMFYNSEFNGDISNWNVENVTNTRWMFYNSKFNGDISNWDVENVTYMGCMFADSNFNGDISSWDVSNVEFMANMFSSSMFNRDISMWEVGEGCDHFFIFDNCPLENKPEFQPKFNKK